MYIDKFEMFRKLPEKFMKEHRNGEKELNDKSYRGNDVPPGHETGVVFPVAPTLSVLLFVLLVYVLMIPSSSPTSLSSKPVNVMGGNSYISIVKHFQFFCSCDWCTS